MSVVFAILSGLDDTFGNFMFVAVDACTLTSSFVCTSCSVAFAFASQRYIPLKLESIQLKQPIRESMRPHMLSRKSYSNILSLIEAIEGLPDVKIYRKEFLQDICKSLKEAERFGISSTESIERNRNLLRQKGRKIQGKGIGTTLLTKGLEFDTVVVLNAHRFTDRKHLYVALTRCCKQLIIISNGNILNPS
jgi:DNA helicase-2/ATP-dependent DNA helicase PcrA